MRVNCPLAQNFLIVQFSIISNLKNGYQGIVKEPSFRHSPVLRVVDGVIVVDGGLLLDDLGPGAGARHGRAEEDVDQQHDGEEHAERDAQPQQPLVSLGAQAASAAVVDSG